jgi:hypothetical protein
MKDLVKWAIMMGTTPSWPIDNSLTTIREGKSQFKKGQRLYIFAGEEEGGKEEGGAYAKDVCRLQKFSPTFLSA